MLINYKSDLTQKRSHIIK